MYLVFQIEYVYFIVNVTDRGECVINDAALQPVTKSDVVVAAQRMLIVILLHHSLALLFKLNSPLVINNRSSVVRITATTHHQTRCQFSGVHSLVSLSSAVMTQEPL